MSYRLARGESATDGMRRLVLEQLDAALDDLESRDEHDHDERVHDARKRLKKARAVLRLVRPALGEETFRHDNACFRDAAQELGGARQGAALVECLERLYSAHAGEVRPDAFSGVHKLLEERRAHAVGDTLERGVESEVAQTLRLASHRVRSWTLDADRWDALSGGLEKTYARGRKAFEAAYAEPGTETFHEWRKRVKDHWYHVRLLQRIWPKPMQARRRALRELADLLGDDHDLGELRDVLRALPPSLAADLRVDGLLALVDQRERALRSQARHIGRRVFAEEPRHLARRFGGYYEAWTFTGAEASDDASGAATPGRNTSA